MTNPTDPLPLSLELWGEQFLHRTGEQPRSRRLPFGRGLALCLALLALSAGVAAAANSGLFDFDPATSDVPTFGGGHGKIAYIDLKTNEPIRCPDGELLTLDASRVMQGPPQCSDGSTPEVFTDQERAFEEWMRSQSFGTPLRDGPNFSFELNAGSETRP